MAQNQLTFTIAISIICLQLISINAEIETKDIRLGWITMGELINWGECNHDKMIRYEDAYAHVLHTISSPSRAKCTKGDWILDWDDDDLGQQKNNQNCLSVPASYQFGECKTCPCTGPDRQDRVVNVLTLNRFSLRPQESDIANNKVVTGVRLVAGSRTIHLEIKQATLQINEKVADDGAWIPAPVKQKEHYAQGETDITEDELHIQWDIRTVYLDEIILPSGFFVTGVRFAAVKSGRKGIKLEIKGTMSNDSANLDNTTDKWYNADESFTEDESYKRPRTEIKLTNYQDSSLAPENIEITDTNRFVKFRGSYLTANMTFPTIPHLSTIPAETRKNLPLQGVGLSYKGYPGYGGYITVKVIPVTFIDPPGSVN